MITICTNDETNRSTLIRALLDDGRSPDGTEEACSQYENDIWVTVVNKYFEDVYPDDRNVSARWNDWNGGRFHQHGYRSGIVHSNESQDVADDVAETIADILAKVVENWAF